MLKPSLKHQWQDQREETRSTSALKWNIYVLSASEVNVSKESQKKMLYRLDNMKRTLQRLLIDLANGKGI